MDNSSVKGILRSLDDVKFFTSFLKRSYFHFGVILSLITFISISASGKVAAQSSHASLKGVISHVDNNTLAGAEVILKETGERRVTNIDGGYHFEEIKEGDYTIVITHPGFKTEKLNVKVSENESVIQNVKLVTRPDSEIRRRTFSNILTAEQISDFGDYSVEEAMARFPGIQVNREGKINIRGVGYNSYYVTVNGQRMGTTGLGDRTFDLGAISIDMVKELELIKVLTPDMDADGLAGVINLSTYQPVKTDHKIEIGLGGGLNPEYVNQAGPAGRGWFRYLGSLSDEVTMSLNVSYQQEEHTRETLGIEYGAMDFGNGNVDVLDRISPGLQTDGRTRLGGSIQFDYQPNERETYYLQGMINTDSRERKRNRYSWLSDDDWDDEFTTGSGASYNYDLRYEDIEITQYTFRAGGRYLFDGLNLDYYAGWSQSTINKITNTFPFEANSAEYMVDFSNRERPTAEFLETAPEIDDLRLQDMTDIIDDHIDTKYSGGIDAEIPFGFGSIQLGSSALFTSKDANENGAYSEYLYTYRGLINLDGFELNDNQSIDVFNDRYNLPWAIDSEEALSFFQSSIPNMRLDEELFYRRSNIRNYFAMENIYSGYGMATLEFGDFKLIGGARIEHTSSDYDGRVAKFNRFEQFEETNDTTVSNSYTNFFPHAQLVFESGSQSNLRLAYSRTIARPDFNLIAPFELSTPGDTSFFRGNPELEPIVSDNIDLLVEHSFTDDGVISVGLFYKMLNDFIMETERTIQIRDGEYEYFNDYFDDETTIINATERSYRNANKATVYGFEATLQQQLSFLPGVLSNFGLYANYTWSESEFESDRNETTAFPGQSPHVVNAAIDYSQDRFSAQISYYWAAEALTDLQQERGLAPSAASGEVYLDRYEEGANNLAVNLKYQLSDQFQIWGNIYNLLMSEQVEYSYNRGLYPTSIYTRDGIEFSVGIKLSL